MAAFGGFSGKEAAKYMKREIEEYIFTGATASEREFCFSAFQVLNCS